MPKGPALAQAQPKFGGPLTTRLTNLKLATGAKTLIASEKIVEMFLWNFLILDACGMWLPRIRVSLTRGAIPYDVREDPEMKDKPLPVQVKKTIKENIKGYNWVNFYEEASREFATGPGMLMVPAVMYLLAKRLSVGGDALKLNNNTLFSHGTAFTNHMASLPADHILNRANYTPQDQAAFLNAYRAQVKNHMVNNVFAGEGFFKFDVADHIRNYRAELTPADKKFLDELLPSGNIKTGKQYLEQLFDQWVNRFVQIGKPASAAIIKGNDDMRLAYAELHDILVNKFNEGYRLNDKLRRLRTGDSNVRLNLMQASEVNLLGESQNLHKFLGTKAVQGDLEKLSHFFGGIAKERFAGKNNLIAETVKDVWTKVRAHKGIQWAAGILSALYVTSLVFVVQRHNQYPGERLAHLEETRKSNPAHHDKNALEKKQEKIIQQAQVAASPSPFTLPQRQPVFAGNAGSNMGRVRP